MNHLPKAYLVRVLNDLESSARRFVVTVLAMIVLGAFLFLHPTETAIFAFCGVVAGYVGQGAWKEVQKAKHAAAAQPAVTAVIEAQP